MKHRQLNPQKRTASTNLCVDETPPAKSSEENRKHKSRYGIN
jgi:hypothetical protein